MLNKIFWLGHSSVKIKSDRTIYIDPWKLKNPEPADLILIFHSHRDHFSPDDVRKNKEEGNGDHCDGGCSCPSVRMMISWAPWRMRKDSESFAK